nr:hypothetical protein CFP56_57035 [Quercus suber]
MASSIPPSTSPASPLHYDPAHTALLLLDYQQFAVDRCEAPGKAALIEAIKLRDWALEKNVMVIHSIMDFDAVPAATCKSSKLMRGMLEDVRTKDDGKGTQVPHKLAHNPKNLHELVVVKQPGVVSGLRAIEAKGTLARREIKSLVIAGLSTGGVVLSTVLPAADSGFVVSVVKEACADSQQDLHQTLMDKVFPSQAHVVGIEEVLKWF